MCISSPVVQVHHVSHRKAFIGLRRWKWYSGNDICKPELMPAHYHRSKAWRKPGEQKSRKPGRSKDSDQGFHAYKPDARRNGGAISSSEKSTPDIAVGTVRLWGRVVEHRTGYRAQFAEVRALREPGVFYYDGEEKWHEGFVRLAKHYGVRIVKVRP